MVIAGIDCGLDGAVVVLSGPSFALEVHRHITPTLGEGRRAYDLQGMREILSAHTIEMVWLERQQPIKQFGGGATQGSQASFSIGMCYGMWQGLLAAMQIPFETVSPQTWQAAMFKGVVAGDTKAKSALVAQRHHPTVDWRRTPRCKTPHDGLTDAYCIAEFGRRALAARAGFAEVGT
jgi:hypothetical protein